MYCARGSRQIPAPFDTVQIYQPPGAQVLQLGALGRYSHSLLSSASCTTVWKFRGPEGRSPRGYRYCHGYSQPAILLTSPREQSQRCASVMAGAGKPAASAVGCIRGRGYDGWFPAACVVLRPPYCRADRSPSRRATRDYDAPGRQWSMHLIHCSAGQAPVLMASGQPSVNCRYRSAGLYRFSRCWIPASPSADCAPSCKPALPWYWRRWIHLWSHAGPGAWACSNHCIL